MLSRFIDRKLNISNQKGFSLIELSVVISIAAASTVAFLSWTQPETLTDAQNAIETRKRIDKIEKAIEAFRVERDRLPCPADPYMRIDNSHALGTGGVLGTGGDLYGNDFGTEDLDETQTLVNGITTLGIDCPVNQGAVPVQSLGLSNDYINDAWGRRFTYAISSNLCGEDAGTDLPSPPGGGLSDAESREQGCTRNDYENNAGDLEIYDTYEGNTSPVPTAYTTASAYVVISHGANGYGAFLPSGARLSDAAASNEEKENSDDDIKFVKLSKTPTYDDITSFKTKIQIERLTTRSNARQVSAAECEENSQAIKNISSTQADFMSSYITGYDHTSGLYNTGEQVGLGLMMAIQDICISYYGYLPATIRGDTWSGAQCPGNSGTTVGGTEGQHANETTYSSKNNVCTCADGDWSDGGCTMDWFSASGLNVQTSNVEMWLDANSPETIFTTIACNDLATVDIDNVLCWRDKSGNGNDATIASGNAPDYIRAGSTSTLDFIDFTPANADHMDLADLSSLTAGEIFTIYQKDENVSSSSLVLGFMFEMGAAAIGSTGAFPWTNGLLYDDFGSTARKNALTYNQNLQTTGLYNASTMASEWQNRLNGVQIHSTSSNTVSFRANGTIGENFNGGINTYFNGRIGEIILYDTKLANADRQSVYSYLGDKWDVSILPTSGTLSTEPVLWLDADDENTFYESDCTTEITSGLIGCWADKSQGNAGTGNDAIQANAANQPTFIKEANMNYRNVVLFDTNDYMEANGVADTFDGNYSLFIVGDFGAGTTDNNTLIAVNENNGSTTGDDLFRIRYRTSTTDIGIRSDNLLTTDNQVTTGFELSEESFLMTVISSTDFNFYYNSVGQQTIDFTGSPPIDANRFVLGADFNNSTIDRYMIDGFIGEIIVYPAALTDVNKELIEGYLSDKWAVEISD